MLRGRAGSARGVREASPDVRPWSSAVQKPRRSQVQAFSARPATKVRRFLAHTGDQRLYAAFFLLFTTGMRRGELLGLRWGDLDLDAGRLRIRRAWIAPNGKQQQSAPKTKRSSRQLALDTGTVAALRHHLGQQRFDAACSASSTMRLAGLVFAEVDGTPLNPGSFSKTFKRLAKAAKLSVIRLHDTRHTYATLALQAGVHVKIVSERLGRSSTATTLDTYSHAIPVLEESAAELVASLIYEAAAVSKPEPMLDAA